VSLEESETFHRGKVPCIIKLDHEGKPFVRNSRVSEVKRQDREEESPL